MKYNPENIFNAPWIIQSNGEITDCNDDVIAAPIGTGEYEFNYKSVAMLVANAPFFFDFCNVINEIVKDKIPEGADAISLQMPVSFVAQLKTFSNAITMVRDEEVASE